MAWRKTWLRKSWLNSSLIIYTHLLYFAIYILNTKHAVLSSTVCFTENQGRTCQCTNKNSSAVKCLLTLLRNLDPCHGNETKNSYQFFCEVMSQFDCQTKYSVKWNCTHCLDAYTKWLLKFLLQNYNSTLIDNSTECSGIVREGKLHSWCEKVLARCPYIAPRDGDTPAFDCPTEHKKDSKPCNNYTDTRRQEPSST